MTPRKFWAVVSVVFITTMLRPAVSAIGPILSNLQAGLNLNPVQISLLASLPVLCFGLGAFAGPWLVERLGLHKAFGLVLAIITVGIAARVWFGYWPLLLLSIVVALAIAAANVFFPTFIRAEFPNSIARLTAVYTTLLALFAALASTASVPLTNALGSWQTSLALWALPGILALLSWWMLSRQSHDQEPQAASVGHIDANLWKHPLTWSIVGFFGIQSMNFYNTLSWLPTILVSQGYSPQAAGGFLGLNTIVGVPVGLLITANLKRFKSIATVVWLIGIVTAAGFVFYATGPQFTVLALVLNGAGMASSFPVALALIGMKASSAQQTTQLSAISQGFGYLVAAIGTFAAGFMFNLIHSWSVVLIALAVAAVAQSVAGAYAARHRGI